VTALAISWLDLDAYAKTCRVSRRFCGLTRLRATTPASVRFVLDTRRGTEQCTASEAALRAATAWIGRMAPQAMTLDLRDAAATATWFKVPAATRARRLAASDRLRATVAACARTLHLAGPFVHESLFWSQLERANVLAHLEIHVPLASHERRQLPDAVLRIASLRSLTCSGGRNALKVTSRQVAQLTQLTALDIYQVAYDRYGSSASHESGLLIADARRLAHFGRLAHLRLRHSTKRDLRSLADTPLGARLETLALPSSNHYAFADTFPAALPALRRFETSWLSDSDAHVLARSAPQLVALEIRPRTQRKSVVTVDTDDGDADGDGGGDDEAEYGGNDTNDDKGDGDETGHENVSPTLEILHEEDDAGDRPVAVASLVVARKSVVELYDQVIGISEPPAGAGLVRSLARHLPHLRELVLRRHHADLRPLSALATLTKLVCCDRPRIVDATSWPAALPALVDLRVIDITHENSAAAAAAAAATTNRGGGDGKRSSPTGGGGGGDGDDTAQLDGRRRFLFARFPALEYLRFVRAEDEAAAATTDDTEAFENDDPYVPVRQDPENGFRSSA
jgi:hypothetical protein